MISAPPPKITPDPKLWRNIPEEVRATPRWFYSTLEPVWKPERTEGGILKPGEWKADKAPRHPATGYPVDPKNPKNWSTFEDAAQAAWRCGGLPGFSLSANPAHGANFAVLDMDDVTPEALGWAQEQFAGTFMEWSASGRGLHIWFGGRFPGGVRSWAEFYGHDRYMLCTGNLGELGAAPIRQTNEAQLEWLAAIVAPGYSHGGLRGAEPGQPDPNTTAEMLEAAFRARRVHTGEFSKGDKTGSGKEWGIAKDLIRAGWPSYGVFHEAWHRLGLGLALARKSDPEDYLRRTYRNAWQNVVEELRKHVEGTRRILPLMKVEDRADAEVQIARDEELIAKRAPIEPSAGNCCGYGTRSLPLLNNPLAGISWPQTEKDLGCRQANPRSKKECSI